MDLKRGIASAQATDRWWSIAGSRHTQLFIVAEVDEKDVPPGTVLGDLEEVYGSLEPALSG